MLSKRISKRAALMFVIAAMATGAASKSDARKPQIAPIPAPRRSRSGSESPGCSYWLPRLDGSGRPAELVGVAQPGARGPEVRGLGGEAAVGRGGRTRL